MDKIVKKKNTETVEENRKKGQSRSKMLEKLMDRINDDQKQPKNENSK